jgi:hypothetical protein
MTTCTMRSARRKRARREKSSDPCSSGIQASFKKAQGVQGVGRRPVSSFILPLLVTKLGEMKVNTGDYPGVQGLFSGGVA